MATFVRQTAKLCTAAELKEGSWLQQAELPNGVKTSRGLVNRANIIGTIVEKPDDVSLLLDDGSATIQVRSFEAAPKPIKESVGDLVCVIGKPREYNGERYILLEICKKVRNKEWITYRKKEMEHTVKEEHVPEPTPKPQETVEVANNNPFETTIALIRELDNGDGADTQELLSKLNHDDKEKFLQTLLEEGEIFEIKPGRVKVLE